MDEWRTFILVKWVCNCIVFSLIGTVKVERISINYYSSTMEHWNKPQIKSFNTLEYTIHCITQTQCRRRRKNTKRWYALLKIKQWIFQTTIDTHFQHTHTQTTLYVTLHKIVTCCILRILLNQTNFIRRNRNWNVLISINIDFARGGKAQIWISFFFLLLWRKKLYETSTELCFSPYDFVFAQLKFIISNEKPVKVFKWQIIQINSYTFTITSHSHSYSYLGSSWHNLVFLLKYKI